jgi:hypothetical protein
VERKLLPRKLSLDLKRQQLNATPAEFHSQTMLVMGLRVKGYPYQQQKIWPRLIAAHCRIKLIIASPQLIPSYQSPSTVDFRLITGQHLTQLFPATWSNHCRHFSVLPRPGTEHGDELADLETQDRNGIDISEIVFFASYHSHLSKSYKTVEILNTGIRECLIYS